MSSLMLAVIVLVVAVDVGVAQPSNNNSNTNTPLRFYCGSNDAMSPTTFSSNLDSTYSQVRSQLSNTGVYYARAQNLDNGDAVYGVAQCRNYLLATQCLACFDAAVRALEPCASANGANVFLDNCFLSIVAVKKIDVGYGNAKEEVQNEVKLISHIHHRNLLGLLGWSSEGAHLLLVLEYMVNGSLDRFLWGSKRGTLNWKQRHDIIFGIARGLVHLHNEFHVKIIHRDIKSSNILLDRNFQPKIADFGLARFYPEDKSHVSTRFAGTLGYTAPEYALRGILSDKVDTYSFGIVVLEIISGQRCTDTNSENSSMGYLLKNAWQLYENIIDVKFIDETMDSNEYQEEHVMQMVEIALLCTQSPASKRPTMSEVVSMLPNCQSLGKRQLTKPTLIDQDRRIILGS